MDNTRILLHYMKGCDIMKVFRLDDGSTGLELDHGDMDKYHVIIQNLLAIPNLSEIHFKNLTGKEAMQVRQSLWRFVEVSDFYDIDITLRREEI